MHAGRIIAIGAPGELKARYRKQTIEDLFIDLVRGESAAPLPAKEGEGAQSL